MKFASALALLTAVVQARDLIPPTRGPYSVAKKVVPLVDESRWDLLAPEDKPQKRNILIDMHVPFNGPCNGKIQPYLPPQTEKAFGIFATLSGLPEEIVSGFDIEYCTLSGATKTSEELPVILFDSGLQGSRLFYAAQARSLASFGYLVITIDHPFETLAVEFPNNVTYVAEPLTEFNTTEASKYGQIRADDASFVIDNLPDLVADLPTKFDTSKVLAFGHSMGGHTSAHAALFDPRIIGAMNMDGQLWSPVQEQGLSIPYLFFGSQSTNLTSPSFTEPWQKFRGPKVLAMVDGAVHMTFLDMSLLLEVRGIPEELEEAVARALGTIKGSRVEEVISSTVIALADFVFSGKSEGLKELDDKFEEVKIHEEHLPNH